MSSRTFPAGTKVDAKPIVWRSSGERSSSAPRSGISTPASDAPDAEAQVQAAYRRGLQEGSAQAEADAEQRTAAQVMPLIASLGAIIQELAGTRKAFRMEAEEATVHLAIAIARRILQREISIDSEAILGLVRAGFDRVNARELHRLRIAPGEAAVLEQNRAAVGLPSGVEIASDASLPPGSAIFETSRGELDASTTTQLDEIQRGFADVFRRRKP